MVRCKICLGIGNLVGILGKLKIYFGKFWNEVVGMIFNCCEYVKDML